MEIDDALGPVYRGPSTFLPNECRSLSSALSTRPSSVNGAHNSRLDDEFGSINDVVVAFLMDLVVNCR